MQILRWLALALLCLSTSTRAGTTTIDWVAFDGVLAADCDIIDVKLEHGAVSPAAVEFVLKTGPSIGWYKGIQIVDNTGHAQLLASTGASSTDVTSLPAGSVIGGFLRFEKARILGVHTGVYDLADLRPLTKGTRVTFTWIQDECRGISVGLYPTKSTFPTWLRPGESRRVTVAVVNFSQAWLTDRRYEFFDTTGIWNMKPVPVTHQVTFGIDYTFEIMITAPMVEGTYALDLGLHQRGGYVAPLKSKQIVVQAIEPPAPKPTPTPTPKLIPVPDVIAMSAADAGTAMVNAGLRIIAVDAHPLDPKKTVIAQSPLPGALVQEKSTVWILYELDSAPAVGFADVKFTNCGTHTLEVFKFDGDGWKKEGPLASQQGDAGLCPKQGSKPFVGALEDGEASWYVVVDPTVCTDPSNVRCRVYEWAGWGDEKGPTFSQVVQ
jgi:hypothetical protein